VEGDRESTREMREREEQGSVFEQGRGERGGIHIADGVLRIRPAVSLACPSPPRGRRVFCYSGFKPASICLRFGSRKGGSASFSPIVSAGSSAEKPGSSVAISISTPLGSRR
jgi:hypothetical protein